MYRLRRRRIRLDVMHNQAGDMLDNAGDIGAEIFRHWGPVFAERETDAAAQEEFSRFAVEQHEVAEVIYAGERVAELPMASGIKQGSPLSGTLFAIMLNPLIRRYLFTGTLASTQLCAFADDIGLALARLVVQLGLVIALFERWAAASSLRLNPNKCMLIPARDLARGHEELQAFPRSAEMHVCMTSASTSGSSSARRRPNRRGFEQGQSAPQRRTGARSQPRRPSVSLQMLHYPVLLV